MVLGGEEGLECELYVDRKRLVQVSELIYLGCVLDESVTDVAKRRRKVVNERKDAGAMKFLVNGMGLQVERVRVLHEELFMPILLYGSETMIW